MTELTLKNNVVKAIKKNFPEVFFYKAADQFTSGIPDLIGCLNGQFFAIELKVGKNKPTRIQRYVIRQIERAGGLTQVCYSVREVMQFLMSIHVKGGVNNGNSSK